MLNEILKKTILNNCYVIKSTDLKCGSSIKTMYKVNIDDRASFFVVNKGVSNTPVNSIIDINVSKNDIDFTTIGNGRNTNMFLSMLKDKNICNTNTTKLFKINLK